MNCKYLSAWHGYVFQSLPDFHTPCMFICALGMIDESHASDGAWLGARLTLVSLKWLAWKINPYEIISSGYTATWIYWYDRGSTKINAFRCFFTLMCWKMNKYLWTSSKTYIIARVALRYPGSSEYQWKSKEKHAFWCPRGQVSFNNSTAAAGRRRAGGELFFPKQCLHLRGSYLVCIVIPLESRIAGCRPTCLDLPRLA